MQDTKCVAIYNEVFARIRQGVYAARLPTETELAREFSVNVKADAPAGAEIINVGTVYFPSVPEETKTNAIVSTVVGTGGTGTEDKVAFNVISCLARAWLESDHMETGW